MFLGLFVGLQAFLWLYAKKIDLQLLYDQSQPGKLKESSTVIEQVDYFGHQPESSDIELQASRVIMNGQSQTLFYFPKGHWVNLRNQQKTNYAAQEGILKHEEKKIILEGDIFIGSEQGEFRAYKATLDQFKNTLKAQGDVRWFYKDNLNKQNLEVKADKSESDFNKEYTLFTGKIESILSPWQKFIPVLKLKAQQMEAFKKDSLLKVDGDVWLQRGQMEITARRGEVYLENQVKKLKYLVLNDDVKLIEKLPIASQSDGANSASGQNRQAYAERLEGFPDQRFVLSGAPRVVQGQDIIKGYKITIKEKAESIEVEDAISDVKVKK